MNKYNSWNLVWNHNKINEEFNEQFLKEPFLKKCEEH